jgi:uncharacterized repeat protein (TIGR03806 family)
MAARCRLALRRATGCAEVQALLRPTLIFPALFLLASIAAAACSETFPAELIPALPPARLESRPSNTTCLAGTLPLGRLRLEPIYRGFQYPVQMVDRPDHGLVAVAEMNGRIKVVDRPTGAITTALDIVARVKKSGQSLLGMAIHATKPFVYLTVERDADASTPKDLPFRGEIIRFTTNDGGKTYDPASEKLVIRLDRPGELHPPGTVAFGKDGFLYVGVGESARPWSPDRLMGSILRLDVDTAEPYAIPPDNPYANGGGRPEIWAGGFRNPWRFTIDRLTGELWEGDVGEGLFEEVNKVERGKNYGWPTVEGRNCFPPGTPCNQTGLTLPVFAYPHTEGASITGGYVYRGSALPDLAGKYVFGDYIIGHVWTLDGAGDATKAVYLNTGGPKPLISSFGEDAEGELYVLGWDDGILYKLVPGDAADARPAFPARLSQTGCVDAANPQRFASGLVPYGVNMELWSDGAAKRRFVGIPDGTAIHVEDNGDFTVPNGSVLVKEFSIGAKRIETRLLRRHVGGEWSGATYEWNDEQTDAVLLETAKDRVLSNGQTWAFPSSVQCFVCHTSVAGIALGLETLQLNGDYEYGPGQTTNQLTTLSDLGFIDRRLDPAALPRLPSLTGSSPIEERARGYLHANCSMCHREGGGTGSPMDLRFGLPRSSIGCTPSSFKGRSDVKVVTPGDPGRSVISLRMSTRDDWQMPKLATRKVDEVGVSVIDGWIHSLSTCE